jgi:polysaccharide pyruvyl transferase WcaK-like protein
MKASSVVISNRLHGLILASFADVPVLPFTDRSKVAAFARDTGVPHAIESLDRLNPDMLGAVIRDRETVLAALRRFKAENDQRHFAPVVPTDARP